MPPIVKVTWRDHFKCAIESVETMRELIKCEDYTSIDSLFQSVGILIGENEHFYVLASTVPLKTVVHDTKEAFNVLFVVKGATVSIETIGEIDLDDMEQARFGIGNTENKAEQQ